MSPDDIIREVEVAPEHPFFYPRLTTYLIRANTIQPKNEEEEIFRLCSDEFDDLTRRLDRTAIQESCSVRNVLKTRLIAEKLMSDDGEIRQDILPIFISIFEKRLYSLAPGRQFDAVRDEHILKVLRLLHENKDLVRRLRHITRPFSNRLAEQIIRDTLLLPSSMGVTDVHVRRACLSAWLCTLRQSLGSCFATAPAIIVHQEQPLVFLDDLEEMMNTGCMKRTYAGVENSVPMSTTWGNGDLRKPFFLERDLNHNENKLWMSPGLVFAMEAAGIFEEGLSLKEKTHILHKRLAESIHLIEKPGHIIATNAEELIRVLLLSHWEITQKEVDDYLARPKSMLQSGLMIHVPRTSKFTKTKENPYPAFIRDFDLAKTAFKTLADNALLKSWEFTLASFSESNLDFCRQNLYTSLGVNYDEPGGIAHYLYGHISHKVELANGDLKELQIEYEQVLAQMHYLEGRAQAASTEKEINWVKMEYQSRQTELYHIDQVRQGAHEKAMKVAGLHEFLMREYDKLFPQYFQEVYDAEIHDVASGPFDDSPAGFRLIYKYGRSNPSQWTRIHSLSEFIEALVSFFTITEVEFQSMPQAKGIENELGHLITLLVGYVRNDEFVESAFYRMAKAHGVPFVAHPLENLDKIEKKPWVQTSGGSMSALVSSYFRREEKPSEVSRWVENETELLAFFIDTLKQSPQAVSNMYLKDTNKSMLIHSPTHAFLLKPGYFNQAWTSDMYTYSWIKHMFVEPTLKELEMIFVEEEMAQDILQDLLFSVPQDFRPRFRQVFQRLPYRLSAPDFRAFVVDSIDSDRGLRTFYGPALSSDEVDSALYSHLPYTQKNRTQENVQETLAAIFSDGILPSKISTVVEASLKRLHHRGVISANRLLDIVKATCCLLMNDTRNQKDLHKLIVNELRSRKLLLPAPLLVADSNWVKDNFAFVISPATHELELWSVDFYGTSGKPISYWKMWVNGSRREPKWGIYLKPHEYVAKK